jgi:hypothetical protein
MVQGTVDAGSDVIVDVTGDVTVVVEIVVTINEDVDPKIQIKNKHYYLNMVMLFMRFAVFLQLNQ